MIDFLIAVFQGTVFYRFRGYKHELKRPIVQLIFCLIYPYVVVALGCPQWQAAIAYALSVLACCSGHGQWQALNTYLYAVSVERIDFIVAWFFGQDPRTIDSLKYLVPKKPVEYTPAEMDLVWRSIEEYGYDKLYWRGVFGMAVSGVSMSLAPGLIVMVNGNVTAGAVLALSGALKGFAYKKGWDIFGNTESAEMMTGGFLWGTAYLIGRYGHLLNSMVFFTKS